MLRSWVRAGAGVAGRILVNQYQSEFANLADFSIGISTHVQISTLRQHVVVNINF